MKHDTAGDPMSGLKWTRRTTTKIAAELHELGIEVSDRTVAALLKKMGFSLRVNHKKLAGTSCCIADYFTGNFQNYLACKKVALLRLIAPVVQSWQVE